MVPSPLPQGLRDPPSYSPPRNDEETNSEIPLDEELPPYSAHAYVQVPNEKSKVASEEAPDVLHFVDPNDSITSLSLRYGVPAHALRSTNNLYADHLLAARRTVLIPGAYYKGGVSLSPRPVEGEEEEIRKGKVRRFMTGCKVAEYDVALLYLQQADYDLDSALAAYREDERWEKDHPLEAAKKGKSKSGPWGLRKWTLGGTAGGLTGQLS
ncbi:uncharacterized protein EI97DRAFT_434904 [Westerdykella ornata]|uniref:LysM domain-containing protein n=1 Tax=Westerdykella ornata TaxID=318751 RepID=A0A6A6JEF2_WESOR|nr:uncharacterized protein EI97DRAFT_434904 [Westerdykella ornata]KAF2274667.1 hypothetical protein EI97DRAFT_434904 [Westerdykella ornata]